MVFRQLGEEPQQVDKIDVRKKWLMAIEYDKLSGQYYTCYSEQQNSDNKKNQKNGYYMWSGSRAVKSRELSRI